MSLFGRVNSTIFTILVSNDPKIPTERLSVSVYFILFSGCDSLKVSGSSIHVFTYQT